LQENIEALEFKLSKEQMDRLNTVSTVTLPFPHSFMTMANGFNNAGLKVPSKNPISNF